MEGYEYTVIGDEGLSDKLIASRLHSSAVNLAYLDDPFVKYFVKRPSRRPPLINRGMLLEISRIC